MQTLPILPDGRLLRTTLLVLLLILHSPPARALVSLVGPDGEINGWMMGMVLFGGLALFMKGLLVMTDSIQSAAGKTFRASLRLLTSNRIAGLMTGTLVTAVIQSSSATTVMLVGLVTAGMMTFGKTVPVILGADIGTTITGQIVAFKVTTLSLSLVATGFFVSFLAFAARSQRRKVGAVGDLIFGLGLIFFGMQLMSYAMAPLRSHGPFLEMIRQTSDPFVGILVGAVFTAVVQSSSATIGVIIAMASQGFLTLEAGIALALGANIGTCVTAWIAAIGKPRAAVRVAAAHILFKIIGVVLIFAFIPELARFVVWFSPQADAAVLGFDKLAAETPRQIANAHTVFNVGIGVLFLPFTGQFERLVTWMIPEGKREELIEPVRVSDTMIERTPVMALEAVRGDVVRMSKLVTDMQRNVAEALVEGNEQTLGGIISRDRGVNRLYYNAVSIIRRIIGRPLPERTAAEIESIWDIVAELEAMGDSIKGLARSRRLRIFQNTRVSDETRARIIEFQDAVGRIVSKASEAVEAFGVDVERAKVLAQEAVLMKKRINRMQDDFNDYLLTERLTPERLSDDAGTAVPLYAAERDVVTILRRIANHARKVAGAVCEGSGPAPVQEVQPASKYCDVGLIAGGYALVKAINLLSLCKQLQRAE